MSSIIVHSYLRLPTVLFSFKNYSKSRLVFPGFKGYKYLNLKINVQHFENEEKKCIKRFRQTLRLSDIPHSEIYIIALTVFVSCKINTNTNPIYNKAGLNFKTFRVKL